MRSTVRRGLHREAGQVLLAVLVIMVLLAWWASIFVSFMNRAQAHAGARYRAAAALAVAEAGVHKALSILETVAPDGYTPGRSWRPAEYGETMPGGEREGRFTLSLANDANGGITVTSVGEFGGVERRLRARVHLGSPALLTALHAAGGIRFEEHRSVMVILPYGAGLADRRWNHLAAGKEIWFATTDVSFNDAPIPFDISPGPVDAADGANGAGLLPLPEPVRFLLGRRTELVAGKNRQRVDLDLLRTMGASIRGSVIRMDPPRVPLVDHLFYRTEAAANTSNAALNETAGQFFSDFDLAQQRDSVYTSEQFKRLQQYLKTFPEPPPLHGMIYVKGGVALGPRELLEIVDGALVAENTVLLGKGAELAIRHTARTRTLPGLVVLGNGMVTIAQEAQLFVQGLVYVNRTIDLGLNARVDIVGALLANDEEVSFKNRGAAVVIRYDPAVLGTKGLRAPDDGPAIAWVALWEEMP